MQEIKEQSEHSVRSSVKKKQTAVPREQEQKAKAMWVAKKEDGERGLPGEVIQELSFDIAQPSLFMDKSIKSIFCGYILLFYSYFIIYFEICLIFEILGSELTSNPSCP